MPYHNEAKGQPARMLGKHGWDAAGNCTRCGEAGRCKCDHRQRKLFATVKPKEKMPEDRNKRGGPWPSRRTWEMAKIALAAVESHSPREHGLRLQAIVGCVGEDIAHEWSSFDKALDLPDPEVVIQSVMAAMAAGRKVNGEVPTLARADQALAFLGALSDRVLHHDFGRERWEAGMEIVHGFWDQWRDLCLAATPPMARQWKAGWKIDQQFMNKALPLLERAGIAKKVVT
jgi:hypothetical protein